ncbi:MAG: hypothetical protein RLZZ429_1424, partial [Bacteroidota bacterium]
MKQAVIFLLGFLLLTTTQTFAQKNSDDIPQPPARNIYGEIGGPGILSLNYDQRFKGQKGLGFRVGAGGIGFLSSGVFAIPVGINYLSGSKGHYLELGAGASAITITDGEDFFENSSSGFFGYVNFGYRYQP